MPDARGLGVPQLDRLMPPAPAGSCILLVNEPGVEAEAFLYQAAHTHAAAGTTVVYATFNRPPSAVREGMASYGFDLDPQEGRLVFVDGFSALLALPSDAAYTVRDPTDLEQVAAAIERAAREHRGAVVIVDSVSKLIDNSSIERFRGVFGRIHAALRSGSLGVGLFTLWPYGDPVKDVLDHFDGLVSLKGVEDRVTFGQYFTVERASWAGAVSAKPQLYKAAKPGGVLVYIPKVVVTGPYNAGKSTFVHVVSDSAVSVDRLGTTVALDHGHVIMEGLTADLFGTPGQERFDPILDTISGQALGVIVVVDSTRPETFSRARELMQRTWKKGLPIIVAANKQDAPNALPPEEVQRLLGAPAHVRVVGCMALERESCRAVLKELLDHILLGSVPA